MTPAADWGTTLVETDVDRAVIERLRQWLPTYLSHAEEARGLPNGLLARPVDGSFQNALEDDSFPDGQLPAVVVTTAQTEGDPETGPNRSVYAAWRCNVSVVVRGRTPPETREVAAVFGGCVRAILVHQQLSLEGEVRWRAGNVAPVADVTDQGRHLAAAINRFTVYVDEVITGDGPVIPDPDDPPYEPPGDPDQPYDPLALVTNVTTTILPRS